MKIKLDAGELRLSSPTKEELTKIKKRDLYFILEDVLDTYNIGGIFRLAEALGVKKVYLCGQTETPPNHRIKKASINTTEWVKWSYADSAASAIKNLKFKIKNLTVVAVEQDSHSMPYTEINYQIPLALVVGNETTGVKQETLALSDQIAEIPMWGVNKSLNVIVSLAIVSFAAVSKFTKI